MEEWTVWKYASWIYLCSDSDLLWVSLLRWTQMEASWIYQSLKTKSRKEDKQKVICPIYNAYKSGKTLERPVLTAAFNCTASLERATSCSEKKIHSEKLIWWITILQKSDVDVRLPFLFEMKPFALNTREMFGCTVCNYFLYLFMIIWLESSTFRKRINIILWMLSYNKINTGNLILHAYSWMLPFGDIPEFLRLSHI